MLFTCRPEEDALIPSEKQALKAYIYQLTSHRNFLWFSLMNLVQVFINNDSPVSPNLLNFGCS